MSDYFDLLGWEREDLWEGCMLASIAHAIMVCQYPDAPNEHSWNGENYQVIDSKGNHGIITFGQKYIIGVMKDVKSSRLDADFKEPYAYFEGASDEVIDIVEEKTLKNFEEGIKGKKWPVITAAFWGIDESIYSKDDFEDLYMNGGSLFELQTMDFDRAIEEWVEYYEMNVKQIDLLKSLYFKKVNDWEKNIILTEEEKQALLPVDEKSLEYSKNSFEEIGIYFPDHAL